MSHHAAPPFALCQALIARDPCATLVLDVEERLVAWNDAATAAFNVDAPARGRSISECGVAARMPSLRKGLETVRATPGPRATLVGTPSGDISVAPFTVDDELVGFIVRRAGSNPPDAVAAELTVARADLDAARSELHTSSLDLAAANDALRTANEDLHRRIEELQAAALAERHKDEFLAMLAHELRTPLAPILSAVQILRRQATDNPVVQRAREVVERQALHQARLLDDLLDVSRITRGKIELRRRPVSIGAAVTEAIEDTRGLIQAKAQTLAVSLPEPPLFVDADPTRLTQIVTNLVNNAAKYTHAGGHINITLEHDGDEAVVVVRDNGTGIPVEMLSRIFDLFAQAEPSSARRQGGLGIGLTLVKNLVEMHGGTVAARSRGRGTGSEFEVRLQTVAAPHTEAAATRGGRPARPLRVLLIEDNADTRETLRRVLELDGHEIEEASDGSQGLELALASRPEVVIVDIGLPELDGYEVARRLRDALGNGPRLIALTGYGQPEDRRLSRDAGFDVHLVKPVLPDQLAAALEWRRPGAAA
jgi:signal transduction histidine kinase/ActR/RegA family two-component response regulator